MDKFIAHFILTKLLLVLWLIVTLPFWLPAIWLAQSIAAHGRQNYIAWGIYFVLLAFLLGLYWLSKKMSWHMTIEGLSFRRGVRAGVQDARFHLAFLPWVGRWFINGEDKQEDDDDAT